jgi:ferredoxin-nitrite reductase
MTQTDKKEKLNKTEQAKAKKHPILLRQELEYFD